MRIPTEHELLRLAPGDRAPRLVPVFRHHAAALERLDPASPDWKIRGRITRHRRAIGKLTHLSRRLGVSLPDRSTSMSNHNPHPRPQMDREEATRRAASALDVAAERLCGMGVTDLEVGRALVVTGLSRMSRGMPAGQLIDEIANLIGGIAEANGIDLKAAAQKPDRPSH